LDVPHHITQRGNRRQDVFFSDEDRHRYLAWLVRYSLHYRLEVLAYCLMSNHVHIVGTPRESSSMSRTMNTVHMCHTQRINVEFGWTGHLWQARFYSCALDDAHLWAAIRYTERNPVRAGLVERAEEYVWSSAAFHCGMRTDAVVTAIGMWGNAVEDWSRLLADPLDDEIVERIRRRTQKGIPCGDESFVARIAQMLGRPLAERPRGRPKRASG
jgi:putative transposase